MFVRTFEIATVVLVGLELITLGLIPFPSVPPILFWIVTTLFFFLVLKSEKTATLVLVAELVYGAKGHMFETHIGGFEVSIRMAFFALFLLAWLFRSLRFHRERFQTLRADTAIRWLSGLFALVVFAALVGLLRGNAPRTVFLDGNGSMVLLLAFPLSTFLRNPDMQKRLLAVFFSATTVLAVKSLLLLAAFSHVFEVNSLIYRWVRDPRMFEITALTHNFYRIFSQSHVFIIIAFFCLLLLIPTLQQRWKRWAYVALTLNAATIVIGFSRSFWLAFGTTLALLFFLLPRAMTRGRPMAVLVVRILGAFAAAIILVSFAANYPYLWNRPGNVGTLAILEKRSETDEASVTSRFALLSPLTNATREHPVLGSGLGTTVTFQSEDPRIITQTGGVRTTYAFEWGYLDMLLKFGVVGTAFWVLFLFQLGKNFFSVAKSEAEGIRQYVLYGLGVGFVFLLLTHSVSPYLNHPLGIWYVILLSFLAWPARA